LPEKSPPPAVLVSRDDGLVVVLVMDVPGDKFLLQQVN